MLILLYSILYNYIFNIIRPNTNTTLRTSGCLWEYQLIHTLLAILYCNCQGIISNNLLLISNPNPNPNLFASILTLITLILTPLTAYIAATFACDRDFRIFRKIGFPQSRVSKLLILQKSLETEACQF